MNRVELGARWTRGTVLASCAVLVAGVGRYATRSPTPVRHRVAIRVEARDAAAAEAMALDVWSEERGPRLPLDVVVSSDRLPELTAAGVVWTVIDPDIDATAVAEHARLATATRPGDDWSADYHDYDSTAAHLRLLAAGAPQQVAIHAIGTSVQQRPIWGLRIGTGATTEPVVLIEGTLHAREWLAAAATTCIADRLVAGYAKDPVIRDFVDHTTLWLVPIVNPDGYQYAWSTDRYWRKNRRDGHGVDLNRNFSVAWGNTGSSARKRDETYRGAYAFSEPESAAIRDLALREHVTQSIDFHTYSQLLLYPWNHTRTPAPDHDRLAATGERMAAALAAPHGMKYGLTAGADFYPAAGTMADWMYGTAGAAAYTIELRPAGWPSKGRSGFVSAPTEIVPTCDEALAAVLALRASK